MARGNRQSEGRSARSEGLSAETIPYKEGLPARNEVVLNWMRAGTTVLEDDEVEALDEKQKTMLAKIADAQGVLAKQGQADLVRFNKELREAGDVPLAKNDPVLVNAIQNYYSSQMIGTGGEANTPTYERLGQDGNGYAKTRSFEPVYNKELKAWELVRYANPLLNSDDPKDSYTEKGWFAIKGSPNNKTLETKLKKVAIVMNTFIED
jgi:hypothetical protein